jgi:NADH pyrophosphatase NudC (nudix superfamily)
MHNDQMVTRWQDELLKEALRDLSDWRGTHPKATFAQIEDAVEERIADLRALLTEDLVTSAAATAQEDGQESVPRPSCPTCGKQMEWRGEHERTVTIRGNRPVHLRRRYAVCPACGAGLFPPG